MTGEKNLRNKDRYEIEYTVDSINENNQGPGPNNPLNSIAILILNQSIKMDARRQLICLPLPGDDFKTLQDDNGTNPDVCVVVGWGNGRKGMIPPYS